MQSLDTTGRFPGGRFPQWHIAGITERRDSAWTISSDELARLFRLLLEMSSDGRDFAEQELHPAYIATTTIRHNHGNLIHELVRGGVSTFYPVFHTSTDKPIGKILGTHL